MVPTMWICDVAGVAVAADRSRRAPGHVKRRLEERKRKRRRSLSAFASSGSTSPDASPAKTKVKESELRRAASDGFLSGGLPSMGKQEMIQLKLEAAAQNREHLLAVRAMRAREQNQKTKEAAEKRKGALRQRCIETAAKLGRERTASLMRDQAISRLRDSAKRNNEKVEAVRAAVRARASEDQAKKQRHLEDRLAKAKLNRSETQRKGSRPGVGAKTRIPTSVDEHHTLVATERERRSRAILEQRSSMAIQAAWRAYRKARRSTVTLARVASLHLGRGLPARLAAAAPATGAGGRGPNEKTEMSDDDHREVFRGFQQLSEVLQRPKAVLTTQKLLDRLEDRLPREAGENCQGKARCAHILSLMETIHPKMQSTRRYQAKVLLSSFMIALYPEIVINEHGSEQEYVLRDATAELVHSFAALLRAYSGKGARAENATKGLLARFDDAWVAFLEHFAPWKASDALALEQEMIEMACKILLSALDKCGLDFEAERVRLSPDLSAIVQQVEQDHALLREKVTSLTGEQGAARMDAQLKACRQDFERHYQASKARQAESQQAGAPLEAENVSRLLFGVSPPREKEYTKERIVHELLYNPNFEILPVNQLLSNEFGLLNEGLADSGVSQAEGGSLSLSEEMRSMRDTMERALWDAILDDLKQGTYVRVFGILQELQEGIGQVCDLNRHRELDITRDIQALASRNPKSFQLVDFLPVAETVCIILCKLGAPAREEVSRSAFQQLRDVLVDESAGDSERQKALCKQLRLLCHQLEVLSADLMNSQVRLLSQVLEDDTAIDYIRESFYEQHSVDHKAEGGITAQQLSSCVPRTAEWLVGARALGEEFEAELASAAVAREQQAMMMPVGMKTGGSVVHEVEAQSTLPSHPPRDLGNGLFERMMCALLKIVAGPEAPEISDGSLPEILSLDQERLFHLQVGFKRLNILAACSLIVHSVAGRHPDLDEVEAFKCKVVERIQSLLLHPQTKVSDVIEEIQQAMDAFVPGGTSYPHISALLHKFAFEDGSTCAVLQKQIRAAVSTAMLHEGTTVAEAEARVKAQLSKCGALNLHGQVVKIAQQVRNVAVVTSYEHREVLKLLG